MVPVTMDEGSHFWPQFIGDGRHFLYAAAIPGEIRLGSLTGEPSRVVMKVPLNPSSLVYTPGHLFFGKDSKLFARVFDEATLEFVGEQSSCSRAFRSRSGPHAVLGVGRRSARRVAVPWWHPATLRWFTETGASVPVLETPARYAGIALAPDASGWPSHAARLLAGRTCGSGISLDPRRDS